MSWSKVKNIIILLLTVTNFLLLLFVALPRAQIGLMSDESLSSALSLLSTNDIALDERIVPNAIAHPPTTVTPNRYKEEPLATALLGDTLTTQDLGGDVHLYSNDLGSIRFHSSGEFSAELHSSSFPIGESSLELYSKALLEKLVISAQLTSTLSTENETILTYTQLWNDIPLLDYTITLTYSGNHLTEIVSTRRLAGDSSLSNTSVLPIPTALMKFLTGLHQLGDVCRSITAITPAYSVSTELSGMYTLTPVWCINTDTSIYQLNLVSGALTRISTQS